MSPDHRSDQIPRIPPIDPADAPEDVQGILAFEPEGLGSTLGENNIFSTLAGHPDLFKAWLPFGGALLTGSSLTDRDREIVILRVAVDCSCDYEWGQHVKIAEYIGMSREDIDRVLEGAEAPGWTAHESALVRAVDELKATNLITDPTWATLAETYDETKLIEVTFLAGHYMMLAGALNSFGVQLDDGLEALPG
jgi:4-carboxymuconolactone decarboxylase